MVVRGRELSPPQMGSVLYEKIMREQEHPNWKPILEGGNAEQWEANVA